MLCPFCGTDIDDGSTFCPECSTTLDLPEDANGNMPSQMIYNDDKNHFPEDRLLDESVGNKKGTRIASIVITVAVVAAVVLAIGFLSKKIVERVIKAKPENEVSAAIRKTMFEASSFTLDINVKNLETEEIETVHMMVSLGESSEDTDFYFENGNAKFAIYDGICYKDGKTIEAYKFFETLDSLVYQKAQKSQNYDFISNAQSFNSKESFDKIIAGTMSEEEFEIFFDLYGSLIFSYFMGTEDVYELPAYDEIQIVCQQFLVNKASDEAFSMTQKDGKYEFTVGTEAFLTEFVQYAKDSDTLSTHSENWQLEEKAEQINGGIAYCGEEIPQITGAFSVDDNGFFTDAEVKVGELYEVTVTFSDINGTTIDKALCEALLVPVTDSATDAVTDDVTE